MNKELEALNVLYRIALDTNYRYQKKCKETDNYKARVEFHKNIVESALNRLDERERQLLELSDKLTKLSMENYELKKVLKIIKKKQEDKSIAGFLLFDDLHNRVLDRQGYHYIQLSKDDFEILKEYLE